MAEAFAHSILLIVGVKLSREYRVCVPMDPQAPDDLLSGASYYMTCKAGMLEDRS